MLVDHFIQKVVNFNINIKYSHKLKCRKKTKYFTTHYFFYFSFFESDKQKRRNMCKNQVKELKSEHGYASPYIVR